MGNVVDVESSLAIQFMLLFPVKEDLKDACLAEQKDTISCF